MDRRELRQLIFREYATQPDRPWLQYPDYEVFRHGDNQKWFAVIMDIPKNKLGLDGNEKIDVVNFKCEPELVYILRSERGIFPAYHMNKENWLTAALDGSLPEERIRMLLEMSFRLTAPRKKP